MIFIDSNIPMYLVGADHPHKHDSRRLLRQLAEARERLVTDGEVFQEILHRYTAIGRREAIQPAWNALTGLVDEVFKVELEDCEDARELVLAHGDLSARDALHAAIMVRRGLTRILSFDAGFDRLPDLRRVH